MKRIFIPALLALLAGGCKKDKLDNSVPLYNVGNQSASSIRMFNFMGNAEVTVNNIPLTAYASNKGGGSTALGLSLFPSGIWGSQNDGGGFVLPNSLLDKDGKAHFVITIPSGPAIDTTIANDVLHPKDYYLLFDGRMLTVPRNNIVPADNRNFRIRILHLGTDVSKDPGLINMNGAVTMTYADGRLVSPALNNVAQGSTSDYVELPYGAYQFKIFMSNGAAIDVTRQMVETPNSIYYDPCNPTIENCLQEGIFSPVRTFKPGGVYSIVITETKQNVFTDCPFYTTQGYVNSFRVITEQDPGVNYNYARMQAVNALPGQQVTIAVDGAPLGDHLDYIGANTGDTALHFPYQVFVQGSHHIQAKDANGKVLAEDDIQLYPFDNYTIWAYNKSDGMPGLLFEANDMTSTLYASSYHPGFPSGTTVPDDGTNGIPRRDQYPYAISTRFLNLSPDLPYATFTNDHQLFLPASGPPYGDILRYTNAYVNLAPGMQPSSNPAVLYSLQNVSPGTANGSPADVAPPRYIRVYQSTPGAVPEVPGSLLANVAPVDLLKAYVANQGMYTLPNRLRAENGIYTIALVGNSLHNNGSPARLIVIKHNQ